MAVVRKNSYQSLGKGGARPLVEQLENRTLFSQVPLTVAPLIKSTHAHPAKKVTQTPPPASGAMPLSSVRTFSYVLEDLKGSSDIAAMAQSNDDMLIVNPTQPLRGRSAFDMSAMVAQMHADDPGRVVLAYLNIGEAASYMNYWQSNWKPPTARQAGSPSFIAERDPFGWNGAYPVQYWSPVWQNIFLGPNGIVKRVMKAGFDGVFLDWVGAYQDPVISAAARRAGINPAQAMVNFISRIRTTARSVISNADVVGLNASELASDVPAYLNVVDALAAEDTWFSGTPNAQWDDPAGGDIPADPSDTAAHISAYQVFQNAGKPVFTIDYALNSDDVNYAYTQSRELGFVPLVTQVSVAQPTTTPPPGI